MKTLTKILTLTCMALLLGLTLAPAPAQAQTFAYVVNTSGAVVIDVATNTVVIPLIPGNGNTVRAATTPDQAFVYMTNSVTSGTVSVVSTATNTVVATIPVGSVCEGLAITPDGAFVYVSNSNPFAAPTVSVIATASNTVVATIPMPSNTLPRGVDITPDGAFVYVTNRGASNVSVISTASNTIVATVSGVPGVNRVAITPDGAFAYTAEFQGSGNVSKISTASNTVVGTITSGSGAADIAITPDGAFAYVANFQSNDVSVIDLATDAVVATVPVGTNPFGIGVTPDGAFVYATNFASSDVSVIATASNTVVATVAAGGLPIGVTFATVGSSLVADAGPDQTIVAGNSTTIGGNPTASGGAPPYTYSWTPTTGLNDPTLANPTASPTDTTTYTVTVTDNNGATASDQVTVIVQPLLSIKIDPVNPPITVPVSGGSFQYTLTVTYRGATPLTVDVWTAAQRPGGGFTDPLFQAKLDLAPNSMVSTTKTEVLPRLDAGPLLYCGNVGTLPSTIQGTDCFQLTITLQPGRRSAALESMASPEWAAVQHNPGTVAVPENFGLEQNHPNPFNPSTTISFDIPKASDVNLAIYNLRGQLIQTLRSGVTTAGRHSVVWNGKDARGAQVASGVYLYRLEANGFVQTRKLTLMK